MAYQSLKDLKCSNQIIQNVSHLLKFRQIQPTIKRTDAQLRHLVSQIQLRHLELFWQYRRAWSQSNDPQHFDQAWKGLWEHLKALNVHQSPQSPRDLAISGHEICALLHISPSRTIGQILNLLLQDVWTHPTHNTASYLSNRVLEVAQELGISTPTAPKNKPKST